MFEVGREYEFHIVEDDPRGSGVVRQVWKVEAIEGSLLKLSNPHVNAPEILNTASARFVKAVPLDVSKTIKAALSSGTKRWVDEPPT